VYGTLRHSNAQYVSECAGGSLIDCWEHQYVAFDWSILLISNGTQNAQGACSYIANCQMRLENDHILPTKCIKRSWYFLVCDLAEDSFWVHSDHRCWTQAQEVLDMARPLQQRVLAQHGNFLELPGASGCVDLTTQMLRLWPLPTLTNPRRLEGLLAAQPEHRLSAAEALKAPFLTSETIE